MGVASSARSRRIDSGKAEVRAGQDDLREARRQMADAIVAAATAGTRMRDLVAITGLSREWIRTMLRANGVEPD